MDSRTRGGVLRYTIIARYYTFCISFILPHSLATRRHLHAFTYMLLVRGTTNTNISSSYRRPRLIVPAANIFNTSICHIHGRVPVLSSTSLWTSSLLSGIVCSLGFDWMGIFKQV